MLWYIAFALAATVGALIYRNSSYERGLSTTFGFLAACLMLGAAALLVMAVSVGYHTEYAKPLQKMDDGRYVVIQPNGGDFSINYKVDGLLKQTTAPYDEDETDDEVNVYLTQRKPQVVKRCSAPAEWAVPFGWDWSGIIGCDLNIFAPVSDYGVK